MSISEQLHMGHKTKSAPGKFELLEVQACNVCVHSAAKFILAFILSFSHLCFIGFISLFQRFISCLFHLCFCSIISSDFFFFILFVRAVYHAALTKPVSKINLIVVWLRLLCCLCKKSLAITARVLEAKLLTVDSRAKTPVWNSVQLVFFVENHPFFTSGKNHVKDTEGLQTCHLPYFSNMPTELQRSHFGCGRVRTRRQLCLYSFSSTKREMRNHFK